MPKNVQYYIRGETAPGPQGRTEPDWSTIDPDCPSDTPTKYDKKGTYHCCLPRNHEGEHQAWFPGVLCATWEDE